MESEEIDMSHLSREEGDQEIDTENERMIMMKRVSGEIEEMSPLPREETNDERDTDETANERMTDNDDDKEKTIEDYFKSLKDKSFLETLQFQKENFIELPASDENIHPVTLENRTITDALIALALFFMR